jgi:hypothetical protein
MALIEMTVKHGRTQQEARDQLQRSVTDVLGQFGAMIDKVEWTPDRNGVFMSGAGCTVEIQVDPTEVHVRGDIPFLNGLLASPFVTGFKQIIRKNFEALPAPKR